MGHAYDDFLRGDGMPQDDRPVCGLCDRVVASDQDTLASRKGRDDHAECVMERAFDEDCERSATLPERTFPT